MSFLDRFFGPPNIAKLAGRADYPGLLRALTYTRGRASAARQVRRDAQEALVEAGESAVEPVARYYLDQNARVDPRAAILILREIGRRATDPALRLRVTNKLADLMDLRKENRARILRAIFTLACQPNLPTYYARARAILDPWLQDPVIAIQADAGLGMLVTSLQVRDFQPVEQWFGRLANWSREKPAVARRVAAALGEAAPIINDEYIKDRAVLLLFQLTSAWISEQPVRDAAVGALTAFHLTAIPRLMSLLADDPADAFARQTLQAIAAQVKDSPESAAFVQKMLPFLDHRDWNVRRAAAQALQAVSWSPDEASRVLFLVTLRDFSMTSWADVRVTRESIDRMAAVVDDPRYPAPADLLRHLTILPLHITDREARWRLSGVLARALVTQPAPMHGYIVRGLTALDWQPGSDACAALYWTYRGDPAKAAAPGALAVDALIHTLVAPDPAARQVAAQALVLVYRSGQIDRDTAIRILAARRSQLPADRQTISAGQPLSAADFL